MENENNQENNDILGENGAQNGAETNENAGADPMYPNTEAQTGDLPEGEVTVGDDPDAPTTTSSTPKTDKKNVVEDISKKLEGNSIEETKEDVIHPVQTMPFDITKMTMEQRQALKAMLESTPDSLNREAEKPKVKIRRHNGKYIVDFKRAYLGVIRDHELNRDVEKHMIPVLYKDEKDYVNILYSDFINSEQVVCEVKSQSSEEKKFIEGETFSRKTGRLVQVTRTELFQKFVIVLPDNEGELEIVGKMANA